MQKTIKEVDNRPKLGYVILTIDDQMDIEKKYEVLINNEALLTKEERLLDEILKIKKIVKIS